MLSGLKGNKRDMKPTAGILYMDIQHFLISEITSNVSVSKLFNCDHLQMAAVIMCGWSHYFLTRSSTILVQSPFMNVYLHNYELKELSRPD